MTSKTKSIQIVNWIMLGPTNISPHDLSSKFHIPIDNSWLILNKKGHFFGPGGKGFNSYVKFVKKVIS